MANMQANKATVAKELNPTNQTPPQTQTNSQENNSSNNTEIQALIEHNRRLEKRLDEMEGPETNTKTNSKERYKGPIWSIRYKIYNGKAIVKVETMAMETVKNNVTNKYLTMHEMLLTFSDGTTEKVDYDLYSQLLGWSEGVDLHELNDVRMDTLTFKNKGVEKIMKNHKFWMFKNTPYGDFEVPELFYN